MMRRHAVALCAALTVMPALACKAEDGAKPATERCSVARLHPMGILEHCDDQIRSRILEMEDIRRFLTIAPGGVFYFACPLESLCDDDPQISGWLVNALRWQPSPQDEETVFGIFKNIPPARGFDRNSTPSIAQPGSECGLFDVTVAGLSGRGVCYRSSDEKSSAVVVVVSDATLGYILVFHQQGIDSAALKEKVLTLLPRFKIQVAKGDFGIARWLR